MSSAAFADRLGDRLVVAVNQVPYSQRQLEMYFAVSAGLRAENDQAGMFVDAANWAASLTLFTDDMMILQEAQRLGSFSAADAMLEKYSSQLQKRRSGSGAFAAAMQRLGGDDQALAHALENVLRVAAFRRSKNRQEAQSLPLGAAPAAQVAAGGPKWLDDLSHRSATRIYAGASGYQEIHPSESHAGGRSRGDAP